MIELNCLSYKFAVAYDKYSLMNQTLIRLFMSSSAVGIHLHPSTPTPGFGLPSPILARILLSDIWPPLIADQVPHHTQVVQFVGLLLARIPSDWFHKISPTPLSNFPYTYSLFCSNIGYKFWISLFYLNYFPCHQTLMENWARQAKNWSRVWDEGGYLVERRVQRNLNKFNKRTDNSIQQFLSSDWLGILQQGESSLPF